MNRRLNQSRLLTATHATIPASRNYRYTTRKCVRDIRYSVCSSVFTWAIGGSVVVVSDNGAAMSFSVVGPVQVVRQREDRYRVVKMDKHLLSKVPSFIKKDPEVSTYFHHS